MPSTPAACLRSHGSTSLLRNTVSPIPDYASIYIIRNGKIVDQARQNYWLNAIEYYYYKKEDERLSSISIQAKIKKNKVLIAFTITKEDMNLLYDDYFIGKELSYNLFEIWVKQNIVSLVDNERRVAKMAIELESKGNDNNNTDDHLVSLNV